jgi:DNA polymerase elongation subunit (family B)
MLEEYYACATSYLCGHKAREFDIPYLCRRMKIHGLPLPQIMPTHGQKPWDGKVLDTMEMRKFGDRKAYTGLDLLCNILKIDSPKSDINGSDVSKVYREQ